MHRVFGFGGNNHRLMLANQCRRNLVSECPQIIDCHSALLATAQMIRDYLHLILRKSAINVVGGRPDCRMKPNRRGGNLFSFIEYLGLNCEEHGLGIEHNGFELMAARFTLAEVIGYRQQFRC
jgi:hypothetical protein